MICSIFEKIACIPSGIWAIITVCVSAGFSKWLGPKIREEFQLRAIYLAPFRMWCADFHSELDEFWGRYCSRTRNRPDYSAIQIIDDWRVLHKTVQDGPKWLAKIKKKKRDEEVAQKLHHLLSTIDRLWHKSEEEHSNKEHKIKLKDRFDIIDLDEAIRAKMANSLRRALKEVKKEVKKKDVGMILTYLRKRIP